ncbi:MAG: alanyl-tRNA editing protein [Xanthomonadales bacterium]|nr:alanyl-tRNA editing protein [Xanthomonadales bacterium]
MTEALYSHEPYRRECTAQIREISDRGVVLDRTVFYPLGGGQPGDTGWLQIDGREPIRVTDTRWLDQALVHVTEEKPDLTPGEQLTARIDWDRRHAHMRMHTALHLLGSLIPFGVTGGNISATKSRLDFDTGEAFDKEKLTAELNALVDADHPVQSRWITQEELAEQPDLVRTMSVKPPANVPLVRLLEIPGIDLQPCGGTHVSRTGEIGPVRVSKIENKGKHNRRFNIVFADPD